MIRRILLGLVWFVVMYVGACGITGGIAGGRAGAADPENAAQAGAQAGAQAVEHLRGYFLAGSAGIALVGTFIGFLPGTHPTRPVSERRY